MFQNFFALMQDGLEVSEFVLTLDALLASTLREFSNDERRYYFKTFALHQMTPEKYFDLVSASFDLLDMNKILGDLKEGAANYVAEVTHRLRLICDQASKRMQTEISTDAFTQTLEMLLSNRIKLSESDENPTSEELALASILAGSLGMTVKDSIVNRGYNGKVLANVMLEIAPKIYAFAWVYFQFNNE